MASMSYQHLPHRIGIVGAGQMGAGIAKICALKGLEVLLSDVSQESLSHGLSHIQKLLDRHIKRGGLTPDDAHAAMARISPSTALEPFKRAEFVIEAVTEDEDVKKSVMRRLDQVTQVQSILASNTSSISITRLAAVTSKPHRVVGMHMMHPVWEMPIVELARGLHTSSGTFQAAKSLAEHLGKQVVVSADRPGFMVYRLMMPLINEAFYCIMEGTGSPEDIDRGLRLGMSMRTGPLKLADAMGLDTCLNIMKVLHANLGDSKYRPCPLLAQYVDAGWLGVKTGKGVFSWDRESGLDPDKHPRERNSLNAP